MPVAALKDATVVAEGDDGEVGEVTIATRLCWLPIGPHVLSSQRWLALGDHWESIVLGI